MDENKNGMNPGYEEAYEEAYREAYEEAYEEAYKVAYRKAYQEAFQKGYQIGCHNKAVSIAQNLLRLGMEQPLIAKVTELPLSEINEIAEKFGNVGDLK